MTFSLVFWVPICLKIFIGKCNAWMLFGKQWFHKTILFFTLWYLNVNSHHFELIYNNCDCYIYFPNAFTPDGDGLNEYFCSLFSCKFDSYQLYIYNRWGQLVFESTKPEICWDGKLNNKEVETGVYVWALKYKGPDTKGEQSKHGTVTLIR